MSDEEVEFVMKMDSPIQQDYSDVVAGEDRAIADHEDYALREYEPDSQEEEEEEEEEPDHGEEESGVRAQLLRIKNESDQSKGETVADDQQTVSNIHDLQDVYIQVQDATGIPKLIKLKPGTFIKIVRNDEINDKLQQELSSFVAFPTTSDAHSTTVQESQETDESEETAPDLTEQEQQEEVQQSKDKQDSDAQRTKKILTRKLLHQRRFRSKAPSERLKRFLSLSPENYVPPVKKPLACLNPILKTPKDRLRCEYCSELYELVQKREHMQVCTRRHTEKKYVCLRCNYKNADIDLLNEHLAECRK